MREVEPMMNYNPILATVIIVSPFVVAVLVFLACYLNWLPDKDEHTYLK